MRVYTDPGQYTINEQSSSGFCKEWVIGHVIIARVIKIIIVRGIDMSINMKIN